MEASLTLMKIDLRYPNWQPHQHHEEQALQAIQAFEECYKIKQFGCCQAFFHYSLYSIIQSDANETPTIFAGNKVASYQSFKVLFEMGISNSYILQRGWSLTR